LGKSGALAEEKSNLDQNPAAAPTQVEFGENFDPEIGRTECLGRGKIEPGPEPGGRSALVSSSVNSLIKFQAAGIVGYMKIKHRP